MNTPPQLLDDLRAVGVIVADVWDLVNTNRRYDAAIPVLMDWLEHADTRVPLEHRTKLCEGLVRALTVPAARPHAAPLLVKQFREARDPTGSGLRWATGNALAEVADDSMFDELAELARDRRYGRARQMIVWGFRRSRDPRAVPLLVELLDDDEVAAHAASALGPLKAASARPALERLVNHPKPLVRRNAKKALAKISKSEQQ
jgi:HEAT repeats